ncbi:hypothetical protein CORT_0B05350 [Candida orthopsilosis Co 90-125]|uniref:Uncharacterized protein n=1 Tax=Candida orthopsilosis (strain 90-125) TaxID=1136231 RepID=H8WZP8_CANO9|nr:hypothetical protein CORT_0B05350 [Candida orthopsilosis Co 90-125]CCG22243.1 hypothetical protein CORT_0B05350 [Candida orthopsilosis Co 90-125]
MWLNKILRQTKMKPFDCYLDLKIFFAFKKPVKYMPDEDRKSRLAALRKKRANKAQGSSNNDADSFLAKTSDHIPLRVTSVSREGADYEPSEQPVKDIAFEPEPVFTELTKAKMTSPTSAMKEDLANYYYKANSRTDRALNRIIQEKSM